MRRALLLAGLLVIAGCQAPAAQPGAGGASDTGVSDGDTAAGDANAGDTATGGASADEPDGTQRPANDTVPPDPPTDRLGWEAGYWHNESLSVTPGDGLNESERRAVVARAMARVEVVREREFEKRVPVRVVDRATFRNRSQSGNYSAAIRRFDNAKFEALFLVGEESSSITEQDETVAASVVGYYSPGQDAIVIVSDSDTPRINGEGTLAHELVHALQDQRFGLGDTSARTRDAVQGRNGLIEGEASLVQRRYGERCGEQWACLDRTSTAGGGGSGPVHFGIQYFLFFPYSAGPPFVSDLRERGGWAAVDDAHDDVPDGATEIIRPERYPDWTPADVTLEDRTDGDWERVRPSTHHDRPDYAVPGPSGIAAALAYTLADDYADRSLVRRRQVLNFGSGGGLDPRQPFVYDLPTVRGWEGGRLHVYHDGDRTAYVWKTRWRTAEDATTFAATWERLIAHWGGNRTADGVWSIPESSPFHDAYAVRTDGRTVTVVNAPTERELREVHDV
ncbi:MAG: Hvo_1808 family surface protein [Haloarculaceae archaeon]